MDYNIYGEKDSRKPLREIRQNTIAGQRKMEDQFAKPMADRTPANVDQLYFRGAANSVGRRIVASGNSSSIDRLFGTES